ncbi:hypothetical protein KI614_06500 [Dechloromonas denitrificans]|uniref:hypothetical protein n=1 Tax=Dechloromonas denitrificans TaxID=281362 RepID=UPI001CF83BC5|nr:hypothetical protein [Dechloromonas denitrificans]UCV12856.1 hypothetical protein KI614_06500 [Dechloromonas denitrificans]
MPTLQLQVTNNSVQDRLLLRVSTQDNEEYRIYFTRRYLRELWPHLTAMLAGHLANTATPVTSVDTSESGEQMSFEQPFREDNVSYPLGKEPLLASEAFLRENGEGAALLTMAEGRERSFKLKLTAGILQVLCSMLRAASEKADWNLALDYHTTVSQSSHPGKSLLH